MSATGYTPIQLYRTTTAAATPSAGNLAAGELAINTTDEKLYFKNTAGVVKLLAASSGAEGTVTSVAASGGTTGLTFSGSPITTSGTLTLGGTLGVANGGTGASTFTSNGVLIGNGTSAISATAAGTTGQVLVGNTGGAPSWATLSGIGVTSFSAGTTGLTPSTGTTGAITLAGTLGVANGGTGTSTQFTAGSVVFAGASGVYSQSNANLFWDNSNNRLGIGTSSPGAKLHVVGNTYVQSGTIFTDAITSYGGTSLTLNGGSTLISLTAGTERMRIDSSGNLLVGTTSAVGTFTVNAPASTSAAYLQNQTTATWTTRIVNTGATGDNYLVLFETDTNSQRGSVTYNRTAGLIQYNTTSDYRAKTIHGPVEDVGSTVDALKVYNGTMHGATQSRPMLIAHEAQEVAPYAVVGEKDAVNPDGTPAYQSIDVSALVPLLIAEIQSLRARVAQLEGK